MPRRGRYSSLERDDGGRKWCPQCKSWKTESAFSRSSSRLDGFYHHCKRCERSKQLVLRYGVTLDEFEAKLEAQGGRCGICPRVIAPGNGWALDHDHQNGAFRGVLCMHCNSALGQFEDDVNRLRAAIRYLEE